MKFIQVETRRFKLPKDNLYSLFDKYITELHEKDIVLIASKVVSIHQGRCYKKNSVDKRKLILKEADEYISTERKEGSIITIKNHAFALNAGVDPLEDYYILLPKDPQEAAKQINIYLKEKFKLKELGVIICDSHSIPLRRGVMNYAVGFYGLSPLIDFGKKHDFAKWTVNVIDILAAVGGLYLGEGQLKTTPITIIRDFEFVEFGEEENHNFFVKEDDLFYSLLKKLKTNKGQ